MGQIYEWSQCFPCFCNLVFSKISFQFKIFTNNVHLFGTIAIFFKYIDKNSGKSKCIPLLSSSLEINPKWAERKAGRKGKGSPKLNLGNVLSPCHKYWEISSRYRIHSYKSKTIQGFIWEYRQGNAGHFYFTPLFKEI